MKRLIMALLAFGAATALMTSTASAHNSAGPVAKTTAGPYTVAAYDPGLGPDGRLSYRALIWVTATGAGVDGAEVTVDAQRVDASGAATAMPRQTATSTANVYGYTLPDPGKADYRISVAIAGAPGTGSTTFTVHGLKAPARSGIDAKTVVIALSGLLVLFAAVVVFIRRRAPGDGVAPADA